MNKISQTNWKQPEVEAAAHRDPKLGDTPQSKPFSAFVALASSNQASVSSERIQQVSPQDASVSEEEESASPEVGLPSASQAPRAEEAPLERVQAAFRKVVQRVTARGSLVSEVRVELQTNAVRGAQLIVTETSGGVIVRFLTGDGNVQAALAANLGSLETSLMEAGIKVCRVTAEVQRPDSVSRHLVQRRSGDSSGGHQKSREDQSNPQDVNPDFPNPFGENTPE